MRPKDVGLVIIVLIVGCFFWNYGGATKVIAQTTSGGFPRIYNLWGGYGTNGANDSYFASFNLYAMYSDGSDINSKNRADAIHAINHNTKILITADIVPAHDPGTGLDVQNQWWTALPGTPDYACLLRDSTGKILRDVTYNAAFNNLGNAYCRDVLVNYFIGRWNSSGGHYDGWQVDQAGGAGVSSILGNDIDVDADGVADDLVTVDANYVAGLIDIFKRLRSTFPGIIIHANDSPSYFGQWVNGRLFEMDLKRYLDNEFATPWSEIIKGWSAWTANNTNLPNTTGMMNSPNAGLISSKYNFQNIWNSIKPAMMAEYGTDYDRMRFGLASSMMAGGMYNYDLGSYKYGENWWFDEYGTLGKISSLGYLGQPTDGAKLISRITTADQVVNGDFSSGTGPWFSSTSGTDVVANYSVENGVAHLYLPGAASGWAIFRENYVTVEIGKYYTLSFRAKASSARNGGARVQRAGGAWEYLATIAYPLHFYTDWTQYNLVLKATGSGTNGSLMFDLGTTAGDIYFDDIKFQEGVGGVWQRSFDHGSVLLNEGPLPQTVVLDKTYQKLNSNQAPLYSQRIDDDQAIATGTWSTNAASFDQWGTKIHNIMAPDNNASLTYTFSIPYAGEYEVFAWVAPSSMYSKNVFVTVNGNNTNLDETAGLLGWHSLGKYNFNQTAAVIVKPLGTGQVVGDAFKIVSTARYNDGSLVKQLTLQPKDAIILLNAANPTVTPEMKLGDANGDGKIDGIDYVIWLNHYGQSVTSVAVGDFNNDGKVDGVDYVIWLNNHGK